MQTRLTTTQKQAILDHYKLTQSQQATASHFNVSTSTLYYLTHPNKRKEFNAKRRATKASRKYYDTKKNTEYITRHRAKVKQAKTN